LSIARHGLGWQALDVRDNFPNDVNFEQAHPEALDEIRLLHYLRKERGVSKNDDFLSASRYRALIERDGLEGSNRLLQSRLRALGACPLDGWLQRQRERWLGGTPR
jgi:hypothetical protein